MTDARPQLLARHATRSLADQHTRTLRVSRRGRRRQSDGACTTITGAQCGKMAVWTGCRCTRVRGGTLAPGVDRFRISLSRARTASSTRPSTLLNIIRANKIDYGAVGTKFVTKTPPPTIDSLQHGDWRSGSH